MQGLRTPLGDGFTMPGEFAPHQALAQLVQPGVVMLAVSAGEADPNAPRFDEDRRIL